MGMLATDPRNGRGAGPTGGSIKAAQYKDKDPLQGGGVGYASPKNTGLQNPWAPPPPAVRQKEFLRPKTEKETLEIRSNNGIAPTAKNMGDLAVQFRADADAAHAKGEKSVTDKRDEKIITAREQADYTYNVTRPAQAIEARNKAVEASSRAFLNKGKYKTSTYSPSEPKRMQFKGLSQGSAGGNGILPYGSISGQRPNSTGPKSQTGASGSQWYGGYGGPNSTPMSGYSGESYNVGSGLQAQATHIDAAAAGARKYQGAAGRAKATQGQRGNSGRMGDNGAW